MEEVRESHEKIPEQPEINGKTVHSQLTVDNNIFKSGLPFNIPISDNIHLKIERGNLATEKVDVIVNTTPDFPNLNGEVAKAIISVGGGSIIQECKTLGNIKEGEIQTSRPGRLSCNAIFHVLIPRQWNAKTGQTFVYQMVINCLQLATQQRHNSIAFPVIGAGKTGFPADIVAKAMVKAACDFASQTSNSAVTNVSIVVYSKADAICKSFEKTVPSLFRASSAGNDKTIRHGRSHQHQTVIEASVDYIAPYSKHSEVDDVVIVKVISKNRGKIIQKYIEKLVEEKYTTRKISFKNLSKEYTLTSLEENTIKDLGTKFGIDVQVIQKECCVQLSGLADWVNKCELELVGLLHNEFPALRLGRKEEEGIAGAEQWFYEQDGTRNKVDMSSNFEIRKGHLEKNDFSYYNHAEQREYTVHYVMDGQMEEWPRNDPQKKRRLYLPKQAESGVSYPASWTIFQNDVSEAQVVLAEHEAEFNEVKNKLIKDGCRPTQIVSIKRLENKFLWKQYQLKKAQLEKLNPQTEIEKRLWHGTKVATVDIIIKHGYNRSFAGEANMTSYGKGVYFAAKSSYSDNDIYATPDAAGVKRMFLNRVLTGVYCRGHQHLISPPERPGMIADGYKVCYNSAVDDEKNPTIFVMFHDTQVFPEYLIEYKR